MNIRAIPSLCQITFCNLIHGTPRNLKSQFCGRVMSILCEKYISFICLTYIKLSVVRLHELAENLDIPQIVLYNTALVYVEYKQYVLLFLFSCTVCGSDPNNSTSVTDGNHGLEQHPCYRGEKISVFPFVTCYLRVLHFAVKYRIDKTRLIICLFPVALLFHHFICALLFTKQHNNVSLVTKCDKILQTRQYLEEPICYNR
jgi:hypothetical protein